MADKNSANMVLRTVYVPEELDNQLRDLAFQNKVSKGELMRQFIQQSLEQTVKPTGFTIGSARAKAVKPGKSKSAAPTKADNRSSASPAATG